MVSHPFSLRKPVPLVSCTMRRGWGSWYPGSQMRARDLGHPTKNLKRAKSEQLAAQQVLLHRVGVGGGLHGFEVADVVALHPENHIFGDVRGVVGYAFKRA